MSRVGYAALSFALLVLSVATNHGYPLATVIASGVLGVLAGWIFSAKVLP